MDKPKTPAVEAFWQEFRQAKDVAEQPYDVCRMGDSAQFGEELLQLILTGPKRATACLLCDVEAGGEMLGRAGGHVVVLDGQDRPRAVWRTRTVEIKPLNQIDDAFAWDEGEGQRTREDWLAMHVRYFGRRARAEGFAFDETMPAVFERFTLVWPPAYADTGSA
jgi:uncharacterized protein YhfF